MIKTVIFDLDGTLVDSSKDIASAVNFVRAKFSLAPLTVTQVVAAVGHGVAELMSATIPENVSATKEELKDMIIDYYSKNLVVETVTYPGIRPLIEELCLNYDLAIASNKPLELSRRALHELGLHNAFLKITGPETTGAGKPDTGMLRDIAEHFGNKPEEMVMVGDSPVDIEAAKNFGCRAFAVTWGYNTKETLKNCHPDRVINTPSEMIDYL